jgi:hypothetical protein
MRAHEDDRPIGELARVGDLVFVLPSRCHGFGRIVAVTATHVTSRKVQSEARRDVSVPADWPARWNETPRGAAWSSRSAQQARRAARLARERDALIRLPTAGL